MSRDEEVGIGGCEGGNSIGWEDASVAVWLELYTRCRPFIHLRQVIQSDILFSLNR